MGEIIIILLIISSLSLCVVGPIIYFSVALIFAVVKFIIDKLNDWF